MSVSNKIKNMLEERYKAFIVHRNDNEKIDAYNKLLDLRERIKSNQNNYYEKLNDLKETVTIIKEYVITDLIEKEINKTSIIDELIKNIKKEE